MATLLDLPTEIIDQVYSYLDWDHESSLVPTRPDILSISLTCRHLRQTILPLLFRDVTLKLRWADGVLIEPALLELRRDSPHLAKHIRCVCIETQFGQFPDPSYKYKTFVVPENLQDRIHDCIFPPGHSSSAAENAKEHIHQQRFVDTIQALIEDHRDSGICIRQSDAENESSAENIIRYVFGSSPESHIRNEPLTLESERQERIRQDITLEERLGLPASSTSTTDKARQLREFKSFRLQLEACIVVMLCLPASINSLVFEATPTDRIDALQNRFALHTAAMAIKLYGDRLQRMTIITAASGAAARALNGADSPLATNILSESVISNLERTGSLILSDHRAHHVGIGRIYRETGSQDSQVWHKISSTVLHLELWNMGNTSEDFIKIIRGFTCLQSITLQNLLLVVHRFQPRPGAQMDPTVWLAFLIELRRLLPEVVMLKLSDLRYNREMLAIPASGIRWLLEAVPPKGVVDFERETRLMEDFPSFIPLWEAEDSYRGKDAQEQRKDGRLVDTAMCSRWQTYRNMR